MSAKNNTIKEEANTSKASTDKTNPSLEEKYNRYKNFLSELMNPGLGLNEEQDLEETHDSRFKHSR
jgi:hypothetical protein